MVIGYSAILLPELQKSDSRIHVDLEIASWIGKMNENKKKKSLMKLQTINHAINLKVYVFFLFYSINRSVADGIRLFACWILNGFFWP